MLSFCPIREVKQRWGLVISWIDGGRIDENYLIHRLDTQRYLWLSYRELNSPLRVHQNNRYAEMIWTKEVPAFMVTINSHIFNHLLRSVTSPSDEKRKQTIPTQVFYLKISNIFLGTVSIWMAVNFMRLLNILNESWCIKKLIQATVIVWFLNSVREDFHIFPNITSFGNEWWRFKFYG